MSSIDDARMPTLRDKIREQEEAMQREIEKAARAKKVDKKKKSKK